MTKTVLITGASSGFGKMTAERLAGDGWQVAATMRNIDAASMFDHPFRDVPRGRQIWD